MIFLKIQKLFTLSILEVTSFEGSPSQEWTRWTIEGCWVSFFANSPVSVL